MVNERSPLKKAQNPVLGIAHGPSPDHGECGLTPRTAWQRFQPHDRGSPKTKSMPQLGLRTQERREAQHLLCGGDHHSSVSPMASQETPQRSNSAYRRPMSGLWRYLSQTIAIPDDSGPRRRKLSTGAHSGRLRRSSVAGSQALRHRPVLRCQ
jgi:hypothetical protein